MIVRIMRGMQQFFNGQANSGLLQDICCPALHWYPLPAVPPKQVTPPARCIPRNQTVADERPARER